MENQEKSALNKHSALSIDQKEKATKSIKQQQKIEKTVRKKLHSYLEDKNLYNSFQHGFRPGRSCLSQLPANVERLTSNLQIDEDVDVIYLDFSKASDKVDHTINSAPQTRKYWN